MAQILAFVENDMYVRNFLSSGAFDELIARRGAKISPSELVSREGLRPWEAACVQGYERHPRNRRVVFGFNKLALRRYRYLSSTFAIKARTGIPFGRYDLRERVKSHPWVYDRFVAPRLMSRISPNESLEAVILQERPALVLFPITGVESTGYELINLSRRHGFRTFFLVNGWDNLSSKTVFGALPDYMGLWGLQSRDDATRIHGLPERRGFLLGCARYEPYFRGGDFGGSPFTFPYAVFAGATTPYDELTPLRSLDRELTRLGVGEFKIVYRPHPWRDKRACDDLFKPEEFRHTVLDPQVERAYYDNKRTGQESVSARSMPDLNYYPALLNHASFVISPMSSMSLEAALFNVPAIVLANDDGIHAMSAHLLARFRHFEGGRQVQGWKFVDRLSELPAVLEQVYRATREDTPTHRSFAPQLARAMAPYLHMDERSYGRRLLDAVDSILEREGDDPGSGAVRSDRQASNMAKV
jgi:hypothetical protein